MKEPDWTYGMNDNFRPKCDCCGKFRKWDDLRCDYSPEFEDGSGCYAEQSYWICKKCETGSQPVKEKE